MIRSEQLKDSDLFGSKRLQKKLRVRCRSSAGVGLKAESWVSRRNKAWPESGKAQPNEGSGDYRKKNRERKAD